MRNTIKPTPANRELATDAPVSRGLATDEAPALSAADSRGVGRLAQSAALTRSRISSGTTEAEAAPLRTSPPSSPCEAQWLRLYRQVQEGKSGPLGDLVATEVRRHICDHHVPLVTRISRQFRFRRFDATVSEFELQSAGVVGLMKAVDMFDEKVGASFVAYAAQRIRGEMLDWLREVDPFSRDVRRLERASTRMIRPDGRKPTDEDLAAELEVTPDRVRKLRESRRAMSRQSLDEVVSSADDSGGLRRGDLLGDGSAEDPSTSVCQREMIEVCRNRLSGREAKVFFENALEDRSLKEIGDELGISESRACQIRRSAREKLATFLAGRGEVPRSWLDAFE